MTRYYRFNVTVVFPSPGSLVEIVVHAPSAKHAWAKVFDKYCPNVAAIIIVQ